MIYFAHCIKDYNTRYARRTKAWIEKHYKDTVYDPATSDTKMWEKRGMDYFFDLVEQHQITQLVCAPTELKSGEYALPSGAYWEFNQAVTQGIPATILLPRGWEQRQLRVLTRVETRAVVRGDL